MSPHRHLQTLYGDIRAFFEIFLPGRIARQMFKVNAVVVGLGLVILLAGLLVSA